MSHLDSAYLQDIVETWSKPSSRFGMHRCLSVDEILRFFACELVALEAKATAVSLACCCRGFEIPVLDVLWESQEQLLPLLKSLPGDVWKVEAGRFVSLLRSFVFSTLSHLI